MDNSFKKQFFTHRNRIKRLLHHYILECSWTWDMKKEDNGIFLFLGFYVYFTFIFFTFYHWIGILHLILKNRKVSLEFCVEQYAVYLKSIKDHYRDDAVWCFSYVSYSLSLCICMSWTCIIHIRFNVWKKLWQKQISMSINIKVNTVGAYVFCHIWSHFWSWIKCIKKSTLSF